MSIFTRQRQSPVLTPGAVSAALYTAGFDMAEVDAGGHALTEGFTTWLLPTPAGDRVGTTWHADVCAYGDQRGLAKEYLDLAQEALTQAGYQSEFVTELASDYLAVWVEGGF